jgi:hypothetical protein
MDVVIIVSWAIDVTESMKFTNKPQGVGHVKWMSRCRRTDSPDLQFSEKNNLEFHPASGETTQVTHWTCLCLPHY